jgi:hypothetical protein
LILLFTAAWLAGCSSPAQMEGMVFTPDASAVGSYDDVLQKQMQVKSVEGGEDTNPIWTSEISNEAFQAALEQSLANAGLLGTDGRFKLSVTLTQVDQPLFGFDMTVTSKIRYALKDTLSDKIILDEVIVAPFTATVSDAFAGIKRVRIANEGSARKNIELLPQKLEELNIGNEQVSMAF